MASEPASSLFPNRPIRPLPKRRLRERLSPEVADSIQYPPVPQNAAPLFRYPYPLMEAHSDPGSPPVREVGSHFEQRQPQNNGAGTEEEEGDNAASKNGATSRATLQHANLVARPKGEQGRSADLPPLPSTTSSPEGYDLFENTNNKKRKIPTAGDSVPSGVHTVHDAATGTSSGAAGIQSAEGPGEALNHTSTPYYGSGSFASGVHNVPGPGRGRYGRPRNGKNPLRPLYDSTNSWAGRMNRPRSGQWGSGPNESTGIISTAIANAEKLPPHQGQENISLLHQQSAVKRSPASAQFTFTCDSQVPGSLAWPGSDQRVAVQPHQQPAARAAQPPQAGTTPSALPQAADAATREAASRAGPSGSNQQAAAPPKPPRRSAEERYLAAARARRHETQLYNKRHPPKPEDVWICHFCEYEAIFGTPPKALVRQYEIKERKQRRLEAQRRAQWERMKKGKHKSKKNSKLPAKHTGAAHDAHHPADGRGAPGDHYDHGAEGEAYYEDEYYEDEEYDPDDPGDPGVPVPHDGGPGSSGRGTDPWNGKDGNDGTNGEARGGS